MITLKAMVDGREVPLSQFGAGIENAIYKASAEGVRDKLEPINCPVHGKPLDSILLKKADGGQLDFTLEGCCQKLIDACEEALAD